MKEEINKLAQWILDNYSCNVFVTKSKLLMFRFNSYSRRPSVNVLTGLTWRDLLDMNKREVKKHIKVLKNYFYETS